jgi:hypothetical protein
VVEHSSRHLSPAADNTPKSTSLFAELQKHRKAREKRQQRRAEAELMSSSGSKAATPNDLPLEDMKTTDSPFSNKSTTPVMTPLNDKKPTPPPPSAAAAPVQQQTQQQQHAYQLTRLPMPPGSSIGEDFNSDMERTPYSSEAEDLAPLPQQQQQKRQSLIELPLPAVGDEEVMEEEERYYDPKMPKQGRAKAPNPPIRCVLCPQ